MLLYHFTAEEFLESLKREGLTRGDVPTSPSTGRNGVWLTSLRATHDHGQGDGTRSTIVTPTLRLQIPSCRYLPDGDVLQDLDKLAIRIAVRIPRCDRKLVKWSTWAPGRLEVNWLATLNRLGGGPAIANTWYIYWGVIPPDWFVKIDQLHPSRSVGRQYAGSVTMAVDDSAGDARWQEDKEPPVGRGAYVIDLRPAQNSMTTDQFVGILEALRRLDPVVARVGDTRDLQTIKRVVDPATSAGAYLIVATPGQRDALREAVQAANTTTDQIKLTLIATELGHRFQLAA
jgi:hypothetical protein